MKIAYILGMVAIIFLIALSGCAAPDVTTDEPVIIGTFEECVNAGYPVMESYPRQCNADGNNFVEIVMTNPEPPASDMASDASEPETPAEPSCGDATCDYNENCDTCFEDCGCVSPAECYRGKCKTPECGSVAECDDDDGCTIDSCEFAQHPNAYCFHDEITECKNNDGCCNIHCDANTDDDCRAVCGNNVCEVGETSNSCEDDCE